VLRADRSGSSWPVLIETEAGIFHTKLRGAAQAPAALAAEIIVGELADRLALSVPARVLIDIPPELPSEDRHDELIQLLRFSVGLNLGFEYLPGARNFVTADVTRVSLDLASRIAWLDGLVQNPDRTARNPNLLWSHDRLILIDHGASLGFQHRWAGLNEESPRARGWSISSHVLESRATRRAQVDGELAACLNRAALESAVGAVPEEYLGAAEGQAARRRAAYAAYLWKRLKAPRPFI
jgi:hypothetical protein